MRRDGNRSAEKLKSEIAGGRILLRRKGRDRTIRRSTMQRMSGVVDRAHLKESQVFLKCAVLKP